MSGEPAYCGALRLRQAAHCLLPSLEPSLPIDVRLGPPGRIGESGVVCCGHDHSIWIRRIHGHAHEVAVLQSILGRTPRVRSIDAFIVPIAGGRVDPVRFLATMMAKDLKSNCLSLSPLSVRFRLRH